MAKKISRHKKPGEKEALRQIDFLENSMNIQLANIQIGVSKLLSSSSIFIAMFLFAILFSYEKSEGNLFITLISGGIVFSVWAISAVIRNRDIKKAKIKIFAISSYIKSIYLNDLGVDVNSVDKTLEDITKLAPEEMKKILKKK